MTDSDPDASSARQHRIDFDRNYCEHYAPKRGMEGDYCALGCGASQRMSAAREAGEPNMSPCIGGHKTPNALEFCSKWERRSLERAEQRADAIEAMLAKLNAAEAVITAWREKEPIGKSEAIECPVCGGRLHLSQAACNGHVRARCETDRCVSFLE